MSYPGKDHLPRRSRRQIIAGLGAGLIASGWVACGGSAVPATPSAALESAAPATWSPAVASPSPTAISSLVTAAPTPDDSPPIAPASPSVSVIVAPPFPPRSSPTATPREILRPNGPPRDPGPLDWAHPGPYLGPAEGLTSFSSKQPLITTYYFYWHDLTSPARPERLTQLFAQRPPDPDHYTYLSPATHRKEFEDMQAAGIDFALLVYWGEPGHPGRDFNPNPGRFWSTEGLPPIVDALDQMAAAGHPFKVGMFYDTTILANADLTTPNGKAYFYVNVRDFYSRLPPRFWAAIDGKPIVWLYDTQWVAKFDQTTFDDLTERFSHDFGRLRPYVVREWQWYQSKGVQPPRVLHTDNLYGWGAAPSGFNPDTRLGVAEVGPGFSNTRYCKGGPAANCFDVDREGGAYYARQLQAALRSGRKLLAVETWNEFGEGSAVAETVEFGRTYIDLTRTYADAFHAGRRAL